MSDECMEIDSSPTDPMFLEPRGPSSPTQPSAYIVASRPKSPSLTPGSPSGPTGGAILRVKRRRSQDPAEALEISSTGSKRGRFVGGDAGVPAAAEAKVTFKLAGTVERPDAEKEGGRVLSRMLSKAMNKAKGKRTVLGGLKAAASKRREIARARNRSSRSGEKAAGFSSRYRLLKQNRKVQILQTADEQKPGRTPEDYEEGTAECPEEIWVEGGVEYALYELAKDENNNDDDGVRDTMACQCHGDEPSSGLFEINEDFVYDFYLAGVEAAGSDEDDPLRCFVHGDIDDFLDLYTGLGSGLGSD